MKTKIFFITILTAIFSLASKAQIKLPAEILPMIVTPHNSSIDYQGRVMHIDITSNIDYNTSCDADWINLRENHNGVYLIIDENYNAEPRRAALTISDKEGKHMQQFVIQQGRNESAKQLPSSKVEVTSMNANIYQNGENIERTIDGDVGTLYHSPYSGGISKNNPAILTYNFKDESFKRVSYVPRHGGTNGIFQEVDLLIKYTGTTTYKLFKHFSWKGDSEEKVIELGEDGNNVTSLRFVVTKGMGGFASCAEMKFESSKKRPIDYNYNIFEDDLYSKLRPDFKLEHADTLTNPFVKSLAIQLLKGNYETKYRVASYPCHNSPQFYSKEWCAPGKLYDQLAGVTGINIPANSYIGVVVRDIDNKLKAQLKIVAWYEGKEGTNFDGGNPVQKTYDLHNGINAIHYDFNFDGLAYICYYSPDGHSKDFKPIRAHFVNGQINGYLSPNKSNEEMHQMTKNAKSMFMDVVANKVHAIWTAEGLHKYCKSTDRKPGYKQYMNVLDSLITWEHRLLGFVKYNRVPDLRTMAYVNFTYYMFQGGYGVSFHHNQESRVLNCNNLINHDHDAIWGLSHEWGHQHQMAPYFNWSGMSEVTNNMNSYYNTFHMGFLPQNGGWLASVGKKAGLEIYNGTAHEKLTDEKNDKGEFKPSYDHRYSAYTHADHYNWNEKLHNMCKNMKEPKEVAFTTDPLHAFSYDSYQSLRTFIAIYQYCTDVLKLKDFGPDYYEALRQNDNPEGSSIEKNNGIDKYEIIASAQNNNKCNRITLLQEKYPNSCWVKDEYITPNHCNWQTNAVPFIMNYIRKVSRLSGYNLFPYFERAGFLRQIALRINDYGIKWYIMTPEMYDEFKNDMEALEKDGTLKHCDDNMVKEIFSTPVPSVTRPKIPN